MSESSIELGVSDNAAAGVPSLVLRQWSQVLRVLPPDLELTAQQAGALYRHRGVHSALDLLRLVLAYAVMDWSLRLIGAWCVLSGLADISDVAILKRLRNSSRWLGELLAQLLRQRRIRLPQAASGRVVLRDATTVSRPGSQGTDWRLHLSFDLAHLSVDDVQVTSAQVGESLALLPSGPGDILVGDRGYAFHASLGPTLANGADVVVRINWQNLPLWTAAEGGQRLDIIAWLKADGDDPKGGVVACSVWLRTLEGTFRLRLLAKRIPPAAAERARHKARLAAQKKGRTPSEHTLFACDFVLVVTSLPAASWSAEQVLDLYRLRWQIELFFKRCKSLLNLDHLRMQDPRLTRTYLVGKLLAVLLLEAITGTTASLEPDWFLSCERPVSLWRWTTVLFETLREAIRGPISPDLLLANLPRLQRFLCEAPRRRKQQLAMARRFLSLVSVVNVQPVLTLS